MRKESKAMFSGHLDSYPRLLGDIGGTNARFAVQLAPESPIDHIVTLQCASFAGPLEAIQAYLAQAGVAAPRHAAIGVANPVGGDRLQLTNSAWNFSIEHLRQALGLGHLLFINDFAALALSLPHLGEADRQQIGSGTPAIGTAIGVIGPGTGLGVAGLVASPGGYIAVDGEGGHVSLSPHTDEEFAITALLVRQFGHVSAERVLSGPGLVTLYHALAKVRGLPAQELAAPAIASAARSNSDLLCTDTLATFCALLGSTAGNLALTLGARGGIFLGGGILPGMLDFLERSDFRARFEAKGRFAGYLAQIPSFVITAAHPALKGAASALAQAIRSK